MPADCQPRGRQVRFHADDAGHQARLHHSEDRYHVGRDRGYLSARPQRAEHDHEQRRDAVALWRH
jgi:hypothetical protein